MCCILYCLNHSDFGLVLISNRDEYLKRPAAPSEWHNFPSPSSYTTEDSASISIASRKRKDEDLENEDAAFVLSGVDAHPAGGGTWLGITKTGRIAAITNFTEEAPPPLPQGRGTDSYRSRGSLVKDWLRREGRAEADEVERYLTDVASHMDEWPGFNVLVGQVTGKPTIGYISNRSGTRNTFYLEKSEDSGSGGLSNSCLNNPWDKVNKGKGLLDSSLALYDENMKAGVDKSLAEERLTEKLYSILESRVEIRQRSDFMGSIQIPPVRLVNDAWYATRTATVVLVRKDGTVRWWEKDIWVLSPQGEPIRAEELNLVPRYFEWHL